MNRLLAIAAIASLALSPARTLAAQTRDLTPYLIPDPAAEVAFARSAAPAHISDSATILVLGRTGFTEAVRGTNGFTCAVIRSFAMDPRDSTAWEPRLRAPHCFNAAAAGSILEEMKLRARLVMAGTPTDRIVARVGRALNDRSIPAPPPTAMAYMQSRGQWLAADDPDWYPHVMFYFPGRTEVRTMGAEQSFTIPVIDGSDPRFTWKVILVPVPNWSDGTSELTAHAH